MREGFSEKEWEEFCQRFGNGRKENIEEKKVVYSICLFAVLAFALIIQALVRGWIK